MKANELRIGNIVLRNNKVFEIWDLKRRELELDSVELDEHVNYETYDNIKPIPLTEEWLLKFGFKKEHNTGTADEWYWKGGGISLTHELQLSSSDRHYESMPVDGSTSLKYVHQLQNLYFALTGEELAYRETV